MQFDQLTATAKCGFKEPPSNPADFKQVIKDVLDAEACAIETYNELSEKYRTTDIVTKEIFEDLLEDEVKDEEKWENIGSNM
jgi:ferritin-like protein